MTHLIFVFIYSLTLLALAQRRSLHTFRLIWKDLKEGHPALLRSAAAALAAA